MSLQESQRVRKIRLRSRSRNTQVFKRKRNRLYEIQNLYGFSGDSGIQQGFNGDSGIQSRFGGIHQDSVKVQLGNFQLPRSHSCIYARDKQFPFDHVISIRKNLAKSVVD